MRPRALLFVLWAAALASAESFAQSNPTPAPPAEAAMEQPLDK